MGGSGDVYCLPEARAGFPGQAAGFALEVCPTEGLAWLPHWGAIGGLGTVLSHTWPGSLG